MLEIFILSVCGSLSLSLLFLHKFIHYAEYSGNNRLSNIISSCTWIHKVSKVLKAFLEKVRKQNPENEFSILRPMKIFPLKRKRLPWTAADFILISLTESNLNGKDGRHCRHTANKLFS